MLTPVQVRRRKLTGALSAALGVVLIVLAVMAFTNNLGGGTNNASANQAAPVVPNSSSGQSGQTEGSGQSDQPGESSSEAPPSTSPESSSSAAPSSPADTGVKKPVTVLNAGGKAGLAGRIKSALQKQGWTVASTGNYTKSAPAVSTIYYDANDPQSQQAAQNLQAQFPKLTVIKENPGTLGASGLVILATGDYDPAKG